MADSYFNVSVAAPSTDSVSALLSPPAVSNGPASRSNALQNRITSVLSASYADLEIRDALSVLDERGVQNTADARRNLRLDIQDELIQCNGQIVQDFGKVAEQLQRIGDVIASLSNSCDEIRRHFTAASRETRPMLDEANGILADRSQVETRQQLLNAFKEHFVLSDADLATLTSTAEPVNDDFFRVLARMNRIHEDSKVLLGSEDQRLGLEILEHSSRQLNAAFQKLYRWIQREFKSLDLENPQITFSIRRALRVLAERPTLFQSCLDFFAEAREHILSNNFYAALTGTPLNPDDPILGKAIELTAHDPLRYISDMLAWALSATVSEREALEVLFISDGSEIAKKLQAGIESEPWSRADAEDGVAPFDGRKALNELVDRDLSGVFRQLKQRTEQVIQSHEDAILAYKISNLVTFYSGTFSKLLGDGSSLLETLGPLAEVAMRAFKSVMRDHVTNLHIDISITPDELAPPDFLIEALQNLEILMKSYETSVVNRTRDERVEDFQPILQVALDPFLSGCENLAKRLRSPDDHIFALNFLITAKDALSRYYFADRAEDLQPQIQQREASLAESMHTWFLMKSGINTLINTITSTEDLAPAYRDPGQLATIAQQLDTFLPTATEDARSFLRQLEDRALGRRIIEQSAERFCEDFEEIESLIVRADDLRPEQANGDTETDVLLREVFPRTGNEIRVLLS